VPLVNAGDAAVESVDVHGPSGQVCCRGQLAAPTTVQVADWLVKPPPPPREAEWAERSSALGAIRWTASRSAKAVSLRSNWPLTDSSTSRSVYFTVSASSSNSIIIIRPPTQFSHVQTNVSLSTCFVGYRVAQLLCKSQTPLHLHLSRCN